MTTCERDDVGGKPGGSEAPGTSVERMSRPQRYFDWQAIVDERRRDEPPENTRQRLRWVLSFFALGAVIIWARAIQLEISDGENFRQLAATPTRHEIALPALRGQILARDGALLAGNRQAQALAMEFRSLENPPDARWLRRLARARLPARQRQPQRVAAAEQTVRSELLDVHHRLAQLCGLSDQVWQVRTARIARRVQALAALVNARR
ncbi:MAG TPA: hypothetical protein VHV08_12700, partial [Pirellulales bacterium]|nr:hypothetical protein [Pirellulales bacterium]